jgi:hypothetical protein
VLAFLLTSFASIDAAPSTSPTIGFYQRLPHALAVASKTGREAPSRPWHERKPVEIAREVKGVRLAPSSAPFRPIGGECSTTVAIAFRVDRESIAFTVGRSPEECNEAPRLLWIEKGVRRSDPMPALYDFNVSAAWLTAHYLVLVLEADYEYGSHAERLAFWNLDSGVIVSTTSVHWESNEWDKRTRKPLIGPVANGQEFIVAEAGGVLVLKEGSRCVQVWPDRREYARCPN